MPKAPFFSALAVLCLAAACAPPPERAPFPVLRGPYLGQAPPGRTPRLFAPGFVNFGLFTRDAAMTPEGGEFYFRVGLPNFSYSAIVETRRIGETWTAPEVAPFSADPRWRCLEPCVSPDGKNLFFTSDRPADPASGAPGPFGIWVMKRTGAGWGEPERLDASINGAGETFFPSVTRAGTLYFCRDGEDGRGAIWRSRPGPAGYLAPEKLPPQVNAGESRYNAFVASDESYVILPILGRRDSLGGWDYYIVFRRADDSWSEPVNLGAPINTPLNGENSAFVSRDGRYLFFMSSRLDRDVLAPGERLTVGKLRSLASRSGANGEAALYWVDAAFLARLKPQGF